MSAKSAKSARPQSAPSLDAVLAAQRRRREIARLGAYTMHATQDNKAVAARAMATRRNRYAREIDPDGQIAARDPQALERRVDAAIARDMLRARLAKTTAKAERMRQQTNARLQAMLRATPSDDLAQLGAIAAARALMNT